MTRKDSYWKIVEHDAGLTVIEALLGWTAESPEFIESIRIEASA